MSLEVSGMLDPSSTRKKCSAGGGESAQILDKSHVSDVGHYVSGGRGHQPSKLPDGSRSCLTFMPQNKGIFPSRSSAFRATNWTDRVPVFRRRGKQFALLCMVKFMMNHNMRQERFMMLLAFVICYLRPGEVARLRAKDLVPPVNSSSSNSGKLWSLVLHPRERGQASKIQIGVGRKHPVRSGLHAMHSKGGVSVACRGWGMRQVTSRFSPRA